MPLSRDLITKFLGEDGSLQAAVRRVGTSTEGLNAKMDRFSRGARTAFIGVGVVAAARMGQQLFDVGIEAEAMGRRFDTVFGDAGGGMASRLDAMNERFGVSEIRMKGMAAAVGDLLVPMGLTREAAADMSLEVLHLAGALSEWVGGQRSAQEVNEILTKALLGEREALKGLGVSLTEAEVKARLAEKSQDGLTGAALLQAKAVASLELITEKSADALTAYGTGASDAMIASQKMAAAIDEAKVALGEAFVALAPLVGGIANLVGMLGQVPGGAATAVGALAGFKVAAGAAAANTARMAAGSKLGITAMMGMTGPLGLVIGGLLAYGVATSDLTEKLDAMVAASSKTTAKTDEVWRSALTAAGGIKDTARAVTEAAARFTEFGDGLSESGTAVQRFEQELASIDITTPAERMAELSASILSIWGDLPGKLEEVDVGKAISDAIAMAQLTVQFEQDMATLVDNGFGSLVDTLAENSDKAEAIRLMDYFAGHLAEAADFSARIGQPIDRSLVAMQRRLADSVIWSEMRAIFESQGGAAWEAFMYGLERASAMPAGFGGRSVVDVLRSKILRGGTLGLE